MNDANRSRLRYCQRELADAYDTLYRKAELGIDSTRDRVEVAYWQLELKKAKQSIEEAEFRAYQQRKQKEKASPGVMAMAFKQAGYNK